MKWLVGFGVLVTLAGCGRSAPRVVRVVPTADRVEWASQLGRAYVVSDPALVQHVEREARASGARTLDVAVLALSAGGRHVPVVTLEAADPASYMKHYLRGFLQRIEFLKPGSLGFVELLDSDGRFAWSAGYWMNGGMVGSRPGLDPCSPISHSEPAVLSPPPRCPAK